MDIKPGDPPHSRLDLGYCIPQAARSVDAILIDQTAFGLRLMQSASIPSLCFLVFDLQIDSSEAYL